MPENKSFKCTCAKVDTSEQLIEYLSGIEIIGNIYENQDLLTHPSTL
jgi:hypothetical protein